MNKNNYYKGFMVGFVVGTIVWSLLWMIAIGKINRVHEQNIDYIIEKNYYKELYREQKDTTSF